MSRRTIILIALGYFAFVGAYWVAVPKLFGCDPTGAAVLGNMFEVFNAIFTGLAFLGVRVRIWSEVESNWRVQLLPKKSLNKL
jgi:hypothetical protein